MRYAIPLLTNRISPRCTIAEGILIIETLNKSVIHQVIVPLAGRSWPDLLCLLISERIDTLVCGGIARKARHELEENKISVVDNVSATMVSVIEAIASGSLKPGFGFIETDRQSKSNSDRKGARQIAAPEKNRLDCLACGEPVCLQGERCSHLDPKHIVSPTPEQRHLLEATYDIASEPAGRTLCRLSELIYLGLETKVRRLGVAFCWDLVEPTRILVDVLRRFFDVIAVGCRFGGTNVSDSTIDLDWQTENVDLETATCDPLTQAAVLADAGSELNVLVGLCVGADSIFTGASRTPVTTLFVKDRSLANNPIGALYSEYYLQEALRTAKELQT